MRTKKRVSIWNSEYAHSNFIHGELEGFPGLFSRHGIPCPYCDETNDPPITPTLTDDQYYSAVCPDCGNTFAMRCAVVSGRRTIFSQATTSAWALPDNAKEEEIPF